MLGDLKIRNAKPKDKPYKLSDHGGLYCEISPLGTKTFRYKYRFGGKEKRLTIGKYPEISLLQAREQHLQAKKLLASGIDPGELKAAQKAAVREKVSPKSIHTFESVARQLIETKRKRTSKKHCDDYIRSLELHVFDKIGSLSIECIKPDKVIDVAEKAEARGSYTAHRLIQRMGEVFDFAIAKGLREYNPVVKSTHKMVAPHSRENHPAISMHELPEFLQDLEAYRAFPITKLATLVSARF